MNLKKVEDFIITDVEDLLETCNEFVSLNPFPKHNQLCFLNTPDHAPDPNQGTGNVLDVNSNMFGLKENNFTEFHPMWKDTILYDLYKRFPKPVTRMRLMQVQPKRTYSIHQDGKNEIRYHIAVKTSKEAFFMYADSLELIQIPADGCAYEFNVERPHTFLNCNRHENRWHLVLNGLI